MILFCTSSSDSSVDCERSLKCAFLPAPWLGLDPGTDFFKVSLFGFGVLSLLFCSCWVIVLFTSTLISKIRLRFFLSLWNWFLFSDFGLLNLDKSIFSPVILGPSNFWYCVSINWISDSEEISGSIYFYTLISPSILYH